MFVGKESAKFPPREINHLRMEPARSDWATQSSAYDFPWVNEIDTGRVGPELGRAENPTSNDQDVI